MITGLDHLVLVCPDIAAGRAAYEAVLGRMPAWQSEDHESGTASCLFRVSNTSLELVAPAGQGPVGDRLRQVIDTDGPGLASLVFATADLDEMHRLCTRRGLAPQDISEGQSRDLATGARRQWRRFRCDDARTGGLRTFIIQHDAGPLPAAETPPDGASALDHVVIQTRDAERAAALYGARLGLRFALDRIAEQWNTRFLFFRTGGLTVEVVQRLDEPRAPQAGDRLWGLTWASDDLPAARQRLSGLGLDVSEIRKGRKPGSEVFTLRDGTLGVPTLFISHEGD